MQVFDRIDPHKLDQRDTELWALAIAVILVLAAGMAFLMHLASSSPVTLSGESGRRIFFSFCILSLLLAGYLTERQFTVRKLRRQLEEERTQTTNLLSQASADLLQSLPGYEHFQDRLAMDFRRAVSLRQPLSLVITRLKLSPKLADAGEISTAYVDAAKTMIHKLRGEDSLYLLASGVFGILLPGVRGEDANRVVKRLSEGLSEASGAGKRFASDLRLVNFPEHAATAREMEQVANTYMAEAQPEQQPV